MRGAEHSDQVQPLSIRLRLAGKPEVGTSTSTHTQNEARIDQRRQNSEPSQRPPPSDFVCSMPCCSLVSENEAT